MACRSSSIRTSVLQNRPSQLPYPSVPSQDFGDRLRPIKTSFLHRGTLSHSADWTAESNTSVARAAEAIEIGPRIGLRSGSIEFLTETINGSGSSAARDVGVLQADARRLVPTDLSRKNQIMVTALTQRFCETRFLSVPRLEGLSMTASGRSGMETRWSSSAHSRYRRE